MADAAPLTQPPKRWEQAMCRPALLYVYWIIASKEASICSKQFDDSNDGLSNLCTLVPIMVNVIQHRDLNKGCLKSHKSSIEVKHRS